MGCRIIGVAGGSGSGKTTLAKALGRSLSAGFLSQDSYYIDQSARFDGDGGRVNFDHPSALDFALLAEHLDVLKRGDACDVPVYDFASHSRKKETVRLAPKPVVVVDGTLILNDVGLRQRLDISVFVETAEAVRFARRLGRDVRERGRTPEGVRKQFEAQVKPMHDQFVEPSRLFASMWVSGERPVAEAVAAVLAVVSR
jgi:uridine kinase